jgi:hypothetical protein
MNNDLTFRKSSYSGGQNNDCVEVATGPTVALVRDTKDREGGSLTFGAQQFAAFLATVK